MVLAATLAYVAADHGSMGSLPEVYLPEHPSSAMSGTWWAPEYRVEAKSGEPTGGVVGYVNLSRCPSKTHCRYLCYLLYLVSCGANFEVFCTC